MQQVMNLYAIRFVLFKVYGMEVGGGVVEEEGVEGVEDGTRRAKCVHGYILDSIAFKSEAATYNIKRSISSIIFFVVAEWYTNMYM